MPVAAITALQGLRDKGKIQAGQKVLINGASGGVGTFAVQIAKAFGAEVTGVCSTRNLEMVRSIGADHVIDYTKEDFTKGAQRYDLLFDLVGNHSFSARRRVLQPNGICVLAGVGGSGSNEGQLGRRLLGTLRALAASPFVSQKFVFYIAQINKPDLQVLSELMESGKITPVIDRQYKMSEAREALSYLEQGHARGKVVLSRRIKRDISLPHTENCHERGAITDKSDDQKPYRLRSRRRNIAPPKSSAFLYLLPDGSGRLRRILYPRPVDHAGRGPDRGEYRGIGTLFRLSLAGDLMIYPFVVVLFWGIYIILKPVNKDVALLGAFFRLIQQAILAVTIFFGFIALRLLSAPKYP